MLKRCKKITKNKIIILIILFSLISSFTNIKDAYIFNSNNLINILFILLGFAITSYTFIYSPISRMIHQCEQYTSDTKSLREKANNLFINIRQDIHYMFYTILAVILLDWIEFIDIPYLRDIVNIKVGFIYLDSIKRTIFQFINTFLIGIALYAFYDIMNAMFKLVEENFNNNHKK